MTKLLSRLSLLTVAALSTAAGGCLAPPAYSANERHQQIFRNWDYEGRQAVDDLDHVLLLRPAGQLTIWNVR
ncbi:MAG: hypothetical protein JWO31_3485 [Phycisphaerales bacterium]|nr:hypothetical protein [Phycisphaerales bacterium]